MAGVLGEPADDAVEVVVDQPVLDKALLGVVLLLLKDGAQHLGGGDSNAEVFQEEVEVLAEGVGHTVVEHDEDALALLELALHGVELALREHLVGPAHYEEVALV